MLVDGDDHNDPVADSIRGTLDGHIVLDRAIAEQGRYPPVNVLASVSRLTRAVLTPEQQKLIMKLREMIARFEDTRDLRLMGGYRSGADPASRQGHPVGAQDLRGLAADPEEPLSIDAFQDIARALSAERPSRPARARAAGTPGAALDAGLSATALPTSVPPRTLSLAT